MLLKKKKKIIKVVILILSVFIQDESEMVTISGHQDVLRNDEKNLLKALAHQPLSVAIDASGREFQFYRGVSKLLLILQCNFP